MKPIFVDMAAKELEGTGVGVGTVINFPHGNSRPDVMALEAYTAIGDGANELDVVMNISAALMGEWELVREGLNAVIAIGRERGALVKVILETCYLHVTHIREACLQCADAGADFVKTSTGFGPCGATERGVILMSDTVAGRCQVKASGGIRTYKDAEMFLDLGCTRLGASDVRQLLPH
jgi:deoxyribose-phosphate aldolase